MDPWIVLLLLLDTCNLPHPFNNNPWWDRSEELLPRQIVGIKTTIRKNICHMASRGSFPESINKIVDSAVTAFNEVNNDTEVSQNQS